MPIPRTTECRRSCSIECKCEAPILTKHHPVGSALGLAPRTDETARARNMIKTQTAGLISKPLGNEPSGTRASEEGVGGVTLVKEAAPAGTPTIGPVTISQKVQALLDAGWVPLCIAMDSGAAESVIPVGLVNYPSILPSKPIFYQSATGQYIPNKGSQTINLMTKEETLRSMTFQQAPVTKPLASVRKTCQSGHAVVFVDEESTGMKSFILNLTTGETNYLREEDGNYMLDTWVKPHNDSPGFVRPT